MVRITTHFRISFVICCMLILGGFGRLTLFDRFSFASSDPVGADLPDLEDPHALILLANEFGWNFFDFNSTLVDRGWNVTLAGLTLTPFGCLNRDPIEVTCHMEIANVTTDFLATMDCLIIPSGGHHARLAFNPSVQQILTSAHSQGVVIASLCIGQRVLAHADTLLEDHEVAYFAYTSAEIRAAGATALHETVVSSNGIITGGGGGGPSGGGYTTAPTTEVCDEIEAVIASGGYDLRHDLPYNPVTRTLAIVGGSLGGVALIGGGIFVVLRRNKLKKTA